jgi:hypothetical protein
MARAVDGVEGEGEPHRGGGRNGNGVEGTVMARVRRCGGEGNGGV